MKIGPSLETSVAASVIGSALIDFEQIKKIFNVVSPSLAIK